VTPTIYTYDAAGQLTGKSQSGTGVSPVSYAYDAARNLVRCWGTGFTNQYFYDHARRLVYEARSSSAGTTSNRFVYEGMDVIAKLDETSGEMVYFTRGLGIAPGIGDVLAETHILGSLTQTYFYVQNHRGDTIALVYGSNGTVVVQYQYSAWGEITSHTGSNAWFTFSGKHYDQDAQLYYYGYRWYDAQAKRWTQPDPSGLAEGLDLYQFCGNDPINNVDVYGLSTIERMTFSRFEKMTDTQRSDWFRRVLREEDRRYLKLYATKYHVPTALLTSVIVNELADISWKDVVQEYVPYPHGSFGIAQIQVDTAIRYNLVDVPQSTELLSEIHKLLPDVDLYIFYLTDYAKYERFKIKELLCSDNAVSIEAAARRLNQLIKEAANNQFGSWQKQFGSLYEWQLRDEIVTIDEVEMIGAAYNSPDILKSRNSGNRYDNYDTVNYPDGRAQGMNAGVVYEILKKMGFFLPDDE